MVLVHHTAVQVSDERWFWVIPDLLGRAAMPLFFTLSGFVMWLNYEPVFRQRRLIDAVWIFATARFARLAPLYFVVLFIGCFFIAPERLRDALPALALWVSFTQTWVPAFGEEVLALVVPAIGHLWSVSVEMTLYIAFPPLVLLLNLARTRATRAALVAMIGISVTLFSWFATQHSEYLRLYAAPHLNPILFEQWLTYFSPVVPLAEFILGCIGAAIFVARPPPARVRSGGLTSLLIISAALIAVDITRTLIDGKVLGGPALPGVRGVQTAAAAILTWQLVLSIASRDNILTRLLSRPLIVAGGEISFSIYMLHPLVLEMLQFNPLEVSSAFGLIRALARTVAVMTVTIALSCVTYAQIEVRGREFLRVRLTRSSSWPRLGYGVAALLVLTGSIAVYVSGQREYPHERSRLKDLADIRSALERYRADRGTYPISMNPAGGNDWVGRGWNGTGDRWLPPQLVPAYLARTPRDPRAADLPHAQYVLKSTADAYKLLSVGPEDCARVVARHPDMSDPARNKTTCTAYGYWTPAAADW